MINISLIENKVISAGKKKEIEKRKYQIKKPKSLKDFRKLLLSEFKTNNLNFIKIYSMDWDGEANEIKEDIDFQDEDNIAFKVIYDEDNQNINNEEDEKSDSKSEKDIQNNIKDENENDNKKDESFDSINEDELMNILEKELNYVKKEENEFDSKLFCENLLNDFLNKQNEFINNTKLKINEKIENIMTEQSEFFSDIKNIPQIQESILKTTKNFIDNSKININDNKNNLVGKKGIKHKKEIKLNSINDDKEDEEYKKKSEYDLQFLNNEIFLEKTVNKAKWINFEDIQVQNIGNETFTNEDVLYFLKGENSSKDYFIAKNIKEDRQDISLEDDLTPQNISQKFQLTIRNEEPLIGKTYNFNITIKSEKKEIKMKNMLKIIIKIIDENDSQDEEEKDFERLKNEELERLNNEKLEKERLEKLEKDKEREEYQLKLKQKLEQEKLQKLLEKERLEKEEKEEKERKQREENERKIREENERKLREENERLEKERLEKERLENERLEKERLEKERLEKEKLEKEKNENNFENENDNDNERNKDEYENNENNNEKKEDGENKDKEEKEKDIDKEKLVQQIYDELEDQYYISSFKPEEEIKEQIIAMDCNRERINEWLETIM